MLKCLQTGKTGKIVQKFKETSPLPPCFDVTNTWAMSKQGHVTPMQNTQRAPVYNGMYGTHPNQQVAAVDMGICCCCCHQDTCDTGSALQIPEGEYLFITLQLLLYLSWQVSSMYLFISYNQGVWVAIIKSKNIIHISSLFFLVIVLCHHHYCVWICYGRL